MNGLPYYKAYPRDFIEGTIGMPLELKGAYRVLLDLIYMQDGNLIDNPQYIAGLLGCSVRKWFSIRESLIAAGKITVNGAYLGNYRASVELESTRTFLTKQRENGSKEKKNKDLRKPSLKPDANHTDSDTDKKKEGETIVSPARKRASPKTRIDPDALISEQMRAAALGRGLSDAEAEAQFAKFRNWAVAKGQAYADWNAAWVNWLTSPYFAPVLGAVTPFRKRQNDAERFDDLVADLQARVAVQRLE